jgi:hypothetical protein
MEASCRKARLAAAVTDDASFGQQNRIRFPQVSKKRHNRLPAQSCTIYVGNHGDLELRDSVSHAHSIAPILLLRMAPR